MTCIPESDDEGAIKHKAARPLEGIRVVELSTTIAGPVCARLLADFGADVIKIEPAEGDPGRHFGDMVDGVSLFGASMHRNKRTVVIDLKREEGKQLALTLIDKADILVESFRPGVLERLGFGESVLRERNPRLVTVRISGYGQTGPLSDRPGYGAICEAFAGVRHLTGDPDRPPTRCSLAVTDYLTAVYGAFGAMMALYVRTKDGLGQMVDTALAETAFSMMESAVPAYERVGTIPMRQGSRLMNSAPNSLYPTFDESWILIGANNDAIFRRLTAAMGCPEVANDPRYATARARGDRVDKVDEMVSAWTAQIHSDELIAKLLAADVPHSRVNTIADIFEDQYFRARDMLVKVPHRSLGELTLTGVVPKLSRTPGKIVEAGHQLGEDTEDVLSRDLGLDFQTIKRHLANGVIGCAPKAQLQLQGPMK